MSYRGKYIPINPEKYEGNVNKITYDSLWERRFMVYCDTTPSILKWCREPFGIPYISPIDNKQHKYFIDFWVKAKDSSGNIQTYLIEVKPDKQTKEPKLKKTPKTNRPTKRYINELTTYQINVSKWLAAKNLCEDKKWKFVILTEKNANFK